MKNNLLATIVSLSTLTASVNACSEVSGNWYCNAVEAIQYSNVGSSGTYKQIINMAADGSCTSKPKSFSGPLAPLDEEVSFHFRGPLQLKQFAAYTPTTNSKQKRDGLTARRRRQQHQHLVKHANNENLRHDQRDKIYATIDGQLVSWDNNMGASLAHPDKGPATAQMVTATIDGQVQTWINNWFGSASTQKSQPTVVATTTKGAVIPTSTASTTEPNDIVIPTSTASTTEPHDQTSSKTTASGAPTAPGSYNRVGYYHSSAQTLDNLVFLGNYGGQGSGVWDQTYGNSLSFTNRSGTGGAASPQILEDTTIPSDAEVIIMLDEECENDSCGYVRPGSVAYHGFDGANKVFLMEFGMPKDGSGGFNGDMPAVWLLNAQIPRTLQYGNADCSCWESGCGEFDIAETLNSGSTFLKSTLHTNHPGGDSNYFARPTSGTMKLAVVFSSQLSAIHLQVLPSDMDFPTSLTPEAINNICNLSTGSDLSKFAIV